MGILYVLHVRSVEARMGFRTALVLLPPGVCVYSLGSDDFRVWD